MIASPSDEDPEVLAKKLKVSANVLGDVRKVMEDRDVPEDIILDNLLQKANVNPENYQAALKLRKSGKQIILERQPAERWINTTTPI